MVFVRMSKKRESPASTSGGLTFGDTDGAYVPRAVRHFAPARIVLAKGCNADANRTQFAEAICRAYPAAEVVDRSTTSHSQVDLGVRDPLLRHQMGKRTLVLGVVIGA